MKANFRKIILFSFLSILFCFTIEAQTVSGIITDTDGSALIGVNVTVKGTNRGAVTDFNGNYSINASEGDVLVYSYVGMLQSEQIVSGSTMDVQMSEDATSLSDIVVTATRQPIRKIQTTTAINSIGSEELATTQSESFAEAITATPGVTVENSQGRKATYNIRGFPSGNTYVTSLMDGLPMSGFASRSGNTAEYHGLDRNVERIEVVRGSGATLFGRAAAAGAINVITKTGGTSHGGHISITRFNNVVGSDHQFSGDFDYRADFNLNGPINDNWRYNVGGYLMNDSGYKEWAVKDKGTQFRANIDYLFGQGSSIRFYGMWGNNQFNNLTDSPYDLGQRKIADGWENYNTFYPDNSQLDFPDTLRTSVFAPLAFSPYILDNNGDFIVQNQAEDNREEVEGGHLGLTANINLNDGWSVNYKVRVQKFDWRDHNEITFSSFYEADDRILRLNANSVGKINDVITEARITKTIIGEKSVHNITGGMYHSSATYDRFGALHWYTADVSPTPTYGWFGPPGVPPPNRFSPSSTTSHQTEAVTSFFVGDEMLFNDKLSINVGLRYDEMTGAFNNDPEEVGGIDFDPSSVDDNELEFDDISASLGLNYLTGKRSAVYGSVMRAFSLPSVGLATPVPDENEIVINTEIGYRAGFGDLGIDVGFFNTSISNRLASVFDPQAVGGQTFVIKPVGKNIVRGGELQLTYAPQAVKGLLLRTSVTLQQSQYAEGDDGKGLEIVLSTSDHDMDPATPEIPDADLNNLFGLELGSQDAARGVYTIDVVGNQVHNTPTFIFSANLGYNHKYFGLGFDMVHYAGRYATSLNLYETPDLTVMNANAFGKISLGGNDLRVGVRIKNLLDSANPQQLVLGSTNDDTLLQKQATPDFTGKLGFGIIQIPRRVLITVGYDF